MSRENKRGVRHNRRIMGEYGWTYRCSRCTQYLPDDSFHKDSSKPPFNISYTCKECRKNSENHEPILYHSDKEAGLDILKKMGYDIDGNVHTQFMERMRKKYGDKNL